MKRLILCLLPALAAAQPMRAGTFAQEVRTVHLSGEDVRAVVVEPSGRVCAQTDAGTSCLNGAAWTRAQATFPDTKSATSRDGRIATASPDGLFLNRERQFPKSGNRSWAPVDVRGVAFDARDRLWFSSPQGVGVLDGNQWTLYTGAEGLPYTDFTCVAPGPRGAIWFGTHNGAIRFDSGNWEYRAGLRWLPDDDVRAIAVGAA